MARFEGGSGWRRGLAAAALATAAVGCDVGLRQEVDTYLADYAATYQRLVTESQEAEWASNTRIVKGDTTNATRTKQANEALAEFVGGVENIERIRGYLKQSSRLKPLQTRQLEAMLYNAANSPQTVPDLVRERIAAEAEQTEALYGFSFHVGKRTVTPNDIDRILRGSADLAERRGVWEASKAVGVAVKPGLVKLRGLRNAVVRALGYSDFFSYQVSEYGLTTAEMLELMDTLVVQLRPLYRELHTWARYELAARYGQPVPDLIPAHWLPNRWAQNWSALVTVEGLDVDSALAEKTPEWVVQEAERFYLSLGFDSLPPVFWDRSSLYPLPPDAPYQKNTHASAWHIDLAQDVRSLMSVEADSYWFETTLHELGHIYYFLEYSHPEIPIVLRSGANRAYHEGIGSMIGLASAQRRFLVNRGLVSGDVRVDSLRQLLSEALNYVVFIPFSAGTMTRFEHALYAEELPPDQFNARWWELVARYQGVAPPAPRGDEYADGLSKTHISDDPGQYYDYALSFALLFQLHDHIARRILKQDPHDTDYWGSRAAGEFLRDIMSPGASRPWRAVLRETTGRELDAQALVEYFRPLQEWLAEQNQGRVHTLPQQ